MAPAVCKVNYFLSFVVIFVFCIYVFFCLLSFCILIRRVSPPRGSSGPAVCRINGLPSSHHYTPLYTSFMETTMVIMMILKELKIATKI